MVCRDTFRTSTVILAPHLLVMVRTFHDITWTSAINVECFLISVYTPPFISASHHRNVLTYTGPARVLSTLSMLAWISSAMQPKTRFHSTWTYGFTFPMPRFSCSPTSYRSILWTLPAGVTYYSHQHSPTHTAIVRIRWVPLNHSYTAYGLL